jgi:hypothetical protein
MNLLFKPLPQNLPAFIRSIILAELFKATAEAFGCAQPELDRLSYDERLRAYARFTRQQAETVLLSGEDIQAVKERLYQRIYPLGEKLRKWFGIHTMEDVMEMGQTLYRAIEIDLQGNAAGEITVKSCYFSQFYSCQVCDLISALDDGLFAGLSGGARLTFSDRITDGSCCCRAKLLVRVD